MAFIWLSCDRLSLAGLLTGKEKIFLSPTGVVKYRFLPVGCAGYLSYCHGL